MNHSTQKLNREKFPELGWITSDIEIIEKATRRRLKQPTKLSYKKIIRISPNRTPQVIWGKLLAIKEETRTNENVAIHHIMKMKTEKLRKITNTNNNTNTKIDMHNSKKSKKD